MTIVIKVTTLVMTRSLITATDLSTLPVNFAVLSYLVDQSLFLVQMCIVQTGFCNFFLLYISLSKVAANTGKGGYTRYDTVRLDPRDHTHTQPVTLTLSRSYSHSDAPKSHSLTITLSPSFTVGIFITGT